MLRQDIEVIILEALQLSHESLHCESSTVRHDSGAMQMEPPLRGIESVAWGGIGCHSLPGW